MTGRTNHDALLDFLFFAEQDYELECCPINLQLFARSQYLEAELHETSKPTRRRKTLASSSDVAPFDFFFILFRPPHAIKTAFCLDLRRRLSLSLSFVTERDYLTPFAV